MKASVIIPTYNRLETLKNTLVSLEKQTVSDFEVCVIDDGSQDGTYEFLNGYKGELNLILIRLEENKGGASARNQGIQKARGDALIFLDSDVLPYPELVEKHISLHKDKEKSIAIGEVIYRRKDALNRYLSTRGVHKLKNGEKIGFKCFRTNNSSIRREDLGTLFDERFKRVFGEDIELAYRLEKQGFDFIHLKDAIAYHIPETLETMLNKQRYFGEHGLPILLKKDDIFIEIFKIDLLKRVVVRIALFSIFYILIKWVVILFNKLYVPSIFFDYLLYYNRVAGVNNSKKR